jgi:hypothetical protein
VRTRSRSTRGDWSSIHAVIEFTFNDPQVPVAQIEISSMNEHYMGEWHTAALVPSTDTVWHDPYNSDREDSMHYRIRYVGSGLTGSWSNEVVQRLTTV